MVARLKKIAGIADVRIQQIMGQPTLLLQSARSLALGTGLTELDIADNALAVLSGSGQAAPTYWLDTKNGISHLVNIQTPQDQLTSINDLQNITVDKGDGNPSGVQPQLVGALSHITSDRDAWGHLALRNHAGDRHLRQCRGSGPRRSQQTRSKG